MEVEAQKPAVISICNGEKRRKTLRTTFYLFCFPCLPIRAHAAVHGGHLSELRPTVRRGTGHGDVPRRGLLHKAFDIPAVPCRKEHEAARDIVAATRRVPQTARRTHLEQPFASESSESPGNQVKSGGFHEIPMKSALNTARVASVEKKRVPRHHQKSSQHFPFTLPSPCTTTPAASPVISKYLLITELITRRVSLQGFRFARFTSVGSTKYFAAWCHERL